MSFLICALNFYLFLIFVIKQIKVISRNFGQKLAYLNNFGKPWNFIDGNDAIAFIDNHDNQRLNNIKMNKCITLILHYINI